MHGFLLGEVSRRHVKLRWSEHRERDVNPMPAKNTAVFGVYPHRARFEYALSALKIAGFRDDDFSALIQEDPGEQDSGGENAKNATRLAPRPAVSDVVRGSTLGWLAETRVFVVPSDGPFLIAGLLFARFTGEGTDGNELGLTRVLLN